MARHLWLVKTQVRICNACARGEHEACEPLAVDRDENGYALDRTRFTECACLCTPEWMMRTVDGERR